MKVKNVSFAIIGVGPMMFGSRITETKRSDETHEQLEERTWLRRCTVNQDGNLAIKSTAIHRSLITASKWTSKKLKGSKTYTKRFEAGLICLRPLFEITNGKIELTPKSCYKETLSVPSDGMRGGKKRVIKHFPMLKPGWKIMASFMVTDEALTLEIIEEHAKTAGIHDGLGSQRIGNAGPNGMFVVSDFEMADSEL